LVAFADRGDVDGSRLGGNASVFFDLDSAATDFAQGCAAQSDGRVLLVGSATSSDEVRKIAIARLRHDGCSTRASVAAAGW
jgi:hypothetical protein